MGFLKPDKINNHCRAFCFNDMARKPRIEFEGALYYITIYGNHKKKIFREKNDFLKYLEIIKNYKNRYNSLLYAYALMSNHVHMLVETKKIPLSKIFQGINQSYTIYFNKKYKTTGHLFQGRYKAILCDKEEYLLPLIKYIHNNPVRAKVVKNINRYSYISHNIYINNDKENSIVNSDQVLEMFSHDKRKAKKLYREYMNNGPEINKNDIHDITDQRILGGQTFVERIKKENKKCYVEFKQLNKKKEYSLSEIDCVIKMLYGINLKQLRQKSGSRKISLGRKIFILLANKYEYQGKDIARYIRKDPALITRCIHFHNKRKHIREIDGATRTLRNKDFLKSSCFPIKTRRLGFEFKDLSKF